MSAGRKHDCGCRCWSARGLRFLTDPGNLGVANPGVIPEARRCGGFVLLRLVDEASRFADHVGAEC